jgi:hypothetical protein
MTAVTSEDTIQGTTKEFMQRWGTDYTETSGFLKLLEKKGVVKHVGDKRPDGGKGKPSIIYSIPKNIKLDLDIVPVQS